MHMKRKAADCGMFLCIGLKPVCPQSSAMEILLGLNTQLHSLRPNQVVSELQSSYTAWLDHTPLGLDCSCRLELQQKEKWEEKERIKERISLYWTPKLSPSTCKWMHILLTSWEMTQLLLCNSFYIDTLSVQFCKSRAGCKQFRLISRFLFKCLIFLWDFIYLCMSYKCWSCFPELLSCWTPWPWEAPIQKYNAPKYL